MQEARVFVRGKRSRLSGAAVDLELLGCVAYRAAFYLKRPGNPFLPALSSRLTQRADNALDSDSSHCHERRQRRKGCLRFAGQKLEATSRRYNSLSVGAVH